MKCRLSSQLLRLYNWIVLLWNVLHCYCLTQGITHCISLGILIVAWASSLPCSWHKLTFMCWYAVNQSINQSINTGDAPSWIKSWCTSRCREMLLFKILSAFILLISSSTQVTSNQKVTIKFACLIYLAINEGMLVLTWFPSLWSLLSTNTTRTKVWLLFYFNLISIVVIHISHHVIM